MHFAKTIGYDWVLVNIAYAKEEWKYIGFFVKLGLRFWCLIIAIFEEYLSSNAVRFIKLMAYCH